MYLDVVVRWDGWRELGASVQHGVIVGSFRLITGTLQAFCVALYFLVLISENPASP